MDGSPMLFDLPPLRSNRLSRPTTAGASPRKQPIRNAILAYLTEVRSAKQVADHIKRKTSVATGHLRAMRVRGLVVRVGWGQYVRADHCEVPPDPTTIKRANSDQDLLLSFAGQATSLDELARLTGHTTARLRRAAARIQAKGVYFPPALAEVLDAAT